jgi:hypothetical protein
MRRSGARLNHIWTDPNLIILTVMVYVFGVPMFVFDIGAAAYATALTIARRRPHWS